MDKSLLMSISDKVDSLLLELEHIQNVIGALEIGFKNNPFDSRNMENSSMYVLGKHIESLRCTYNDEFSKLFKCAVHNGYDNLPKNTVETPCTSSMDASNSQRYDF